MEESEIPPLLAAARREGTQMAREVGGYDFPPVQDSLFLLFLYQIGFQRAAWTPLLFLNAPVLKQFAEQTFSSICLRLPELLLESLTHSALHVLGCGWI